MRKLGSGVPNVRCCQSWKTSFSFVMPVLPNITAPVSLDNSSWNLLFMSFIKIRQKDLSLVKIVQKYRTLYRNIDLTIFHIVGGDIRGSAIWKMHLCLHGEALIIYYILHSDIRYVKQQYIREVILCFSGNNASVKVPQHYISRKSLLPSCIYETKPEVWTLLNPIILIFTVRIQFHLFPILRTHLPKIFPTQYFDLKIDGFPRSSPVHLCHPHQPICIFSPDLPQRNNHKNYWVKSSQFLVNFIWHKFFKKKKLPFLSYFLI
jgi:hypothetical protein